MPANLSRPFLRRRRRLRRPVELPTPQKRKRPWGAGVFGSQLGGSWGLLLSTKRLWGAGKEPREFTKSSELADHRRVRTGDGHRLACLDNACGLGVVVRIGTSRNAEAHHRDARNERKDHNLEMCRAISAVDRVVHGRPPAALLSYGFVCFVRP